VGSAALRIRQQTEYPWQGKVEVTLHPARPAEFTLKIRIPDRTESELYTADPDLTCLFNVLVNGEAQSLEMEKGYVALRRTWRDGDQVKLLVPIEVQRVRCDPRVVANRGRVALQRGPLVYNFEDVDQPESIDPVELKPELKLQAVWREDLLGGNMAIQADGVTAVPNFVRLNRGGASRVWVIEDPAKAITVASGAPESDIDLSKIVARTVDVVVIGRSNSERDHALEGAKTASGQFRGYHWRHAGGGGWFSYRMKVDPEETQSVFCSYWGSDVGNRRFSIEVDGEKIGSQLLDNNRPDRFSGVEYAIPKQITSGKSEVTVKLQAEPQAMAGGIFDLRILKTKP
jgi:hypothetical protein